MTWRYSSDEVLHSSDFYLFSGTPTFVPGALVEIELNRVLDQYRESPNLLGIMRNYLEQIDQIARVVANMMDHFDLNSAVGDQLTIDGKVLGFPRCHCICEPPPVVGYGCDGGYTGPYTIAGYCEPGSTFVSCPPMGMSTVCIDDDELYRSILRARRYQMLGLYDIESLQAAMEWVWGPLAQVVDTDEGLIVLSPGRSLSAFETKILPVVFRALPIAPGIKAMVHLGSGPIAGYGAGWYGYCENAEIMCPTDPHTYTCV